MNFPEIILLVTAVLTGLMAGLFYSWSVAVMPGLARLADREFVAAMRAANRAIQNPVFFAAFFGAPVLLAASVFLFYDTPRFSLLLAAFLIYIAGNFGVTVFGNVPLNNRLERFDLKTATDEDAAGQRAGFERRWNNFNTVRTISSIAALVLVITACLK